MTELEKAVAKAIAYLQMNALPWQKGVRPIDAFILSEYLLGVMEDGLTEAEAAVKACATHTEIIEGQKRAKELTPEEFADELSKVAKSLLGL